MGDLTARLARTMALVALAAASLTGQRSTPAHAASPTLQLTPSAAAPHGTIQVSGTGFDAGGPSTPVIVDLSLTSGGSAVPIGTLQTDSTGSIGQSVVQPITLPFTLDAGPTTITATEEGHPGVTATIALTVLALQPQLNGGQPVTAQVGNQIDVKGTGFAPGDTVGVAIAGTPLSGPNGQQTATADATGAVDILLVVPPNTATGTQTLTVSGKAAGTGQKDSASVPLNLTAAAATSGTLQVSPNPAPVGTVIKVSASGFGSNEPVTVTLKYFDSGLHSAAQRTVPGTADAGGNVSQVLSIPPSADGTQPGTVTITGNTTNTTYSAPLSFAQLASISFDPPTAPPGGQVTIKGAGFVPGEVLDVTTRLFKPPLGRFAVVDSTGSFSSTVTLLPSAPLGSTLVVAVSGSGGDQASASFTVAAGQPAGATASPATLQVGGKTTISGHGFVPGEALTFAIGGTALIPTTPPTIDSTGGFTATVTLPVTLAPGAYTLQVGGARSGRSANVALTIVAAPATPTPVPTIPAVDHPNGPQANGPSGTWYFAEGFTGQGPNASFRETLTIMNPNDKGTSGQITYLFPDGSTEALPLQVGPRRVLVEDVNADVGSGKVVSALVKMDRVVVCARTIARKSAAGRPLDTDYSPGVSQARSTWYFAEGYSGNSFQPYLTVQNPQTDPVTVTVQLLATKGAAKAVTSAIPGFGRATLNLRGLLPNRFFAISVAATKPVVAERAEYWGDGAGSAKYGAGVKPGVAASNSNWYFGYSSVVAGDQSYLTLFNPGTRVARVKATFYDGTGNGAGSKTVTVQPGTRATLLVNGSAATKHSPVATALSSSVGIVAEEAQYFGGSPNIDTHAGASIEGRVATNKRWSFAAGDTKGYQESEYVFNPSAKATSIVANFYGADGQALSVTYPVKARAVITISANALKRLHAGVHGSVWVSTAPVVVVQVLRGKDGKAALADQGLPG